MGCAILIHHFKNIPNHEGDFIREDAQLVSRFDARGCTGWNDQRDRFRGAVGRVFGYQISDFVKDQGEHQRNRKHDRQSSQIGSQV